MKTLLSHLMFENTLAVEATIVRHISVCSGFSNKYLINLVNSKLYLMSKSGKNYLFKFRPKVLFTFIPKICKYVSRITVN